VVLLALLVLASCAGAASAPSRAGAPSRPTTLFTAFVTTPLRVSDIVWTGSSFLLVENTTAKIDQVDPSGENERPFTSAIPSHVEEMRCARSPGAHGWRPGVVFCHSPDNKIYVVAKDGASASVFASLPAKAVSDGALVFDRSGAFGFRMLAATGRSPGSKGGVVYALSPAGKIERIASYPGPGGADNMTVAPPGFGSAAGEALLTVDAEKTGRLVAVSPSGRVRALARFADGVNPIAPIVRSRKAPAASAGLYVVSTAKRQVLFAPARDFTRYAGGVIVGSELKGLFWVVIKRGRGFRVLAVHTNLTGSGYDLETAVFVPPRAA
jgi:hypothetical protein